MCGISQESGPSFNPLLLTGSCNESCEHDLSVRYMETEGDVRSHV